MQLSNVSSILDTCSSYEFLEFFAFEFGWYGLDFGINSFLDSRI